MFSEKNVFREEVKTAHLVPIKTAKNRLSLTYQASIFRSFFLPATGKTPTQRALLKKARAEAKSLRHEALKVILEDQIRAGKNQTEIGKELGITRERVRQIANTTGVDRAKLEQAAHEQRRKELEEAYKPGKSHQEASAYLVTQLGWKPKQIQKALQQTKADGGTPIQVPISKRRELPGMVKNLLRENPMVSVKEIAEKVGTPYETAARHRRKAIKELIRATSDFPDHFQLRADRIRKRAARDITKRIELTLALAIEELISGKLPGQMHHNIGSYWEKLAKTAEDALQLQTTCLGIRGLSTKEFQETVKKSLDAFQINRGERPKLQPKTETIGKTEDQTNPN